MIVRIAILLLVVLLCQFDFINFAYYFQLESYNIGGFTKCVFKKTSLSEYMIFGFVLMIYVLTYLFESQTIYIFIFVLLFVNVVIKVLKISRNYAKRKIKFKYTKRMFRLHFMFCFVELLTIIICLLTNTSMILTLYLFNILIFYLCAIVVKPIEKCVEKHYISLAKSKLAKMKKLKIIAITGSYGKTSVKNILYEILSQKYNVCATPASYNTPMGICKCILNHLKPYDEILILEFGAKKSGEIKYLCDTFGAMYAVITNVGPQHLETFKSIENITKTKMELFEYVHDKSNVFVNYNNTYIVEYLNKYPFTDCNLIVDQVNIDDVYNQNNISYFDHIEASPEGLKFDYASFSNNKKNVEKYTTKLLGSHNVCNISLAIAVGKKLGLTYTQISSGLSNLTAIPHRLELKHCSDYMIIDDAYNSNPISFRCAVDALTLFKSNRKIVITPGVIEQAGYGYKANYDLGKYMATRVDCVYVINQTNRSAITSGLISGGFTNDRIFTYDNFSDVKFNNFVKGDVILIENDLPDNYK